MQARRVLQRSRDSLELEVIARTGERNLLATLVESTDVMVMAVDLGYNITAINKSNADEFERIYGMRAEAGDNLLALFADRPDELSPIKSAWSKVLAGAEFTLVERRGKPARSQSTYEIKYRPLRDPTGAQIGAFQFASDITGRLRDQARLAQVQAALIQTQIVLNIEVAKDIPFAKADPNQLEMAVLNLAVNARDAMQGGVINLSVTTAELADGDHSHLKSGRYVRVLVADTGCGMDEATLFRAIEPFFSTKGVGQGTGLGLSMAHGLAIQLGGALTITSQLGKGTQVSIWLPECAESPAASDDSHAQPRSIWAGTALLVDDEAYIRVSTADMLNALGFSVRETSSAQMALAAIDDGLMPELLITDHLMPGMTGVQLARLVRERRPITKTLIISGFAEVDGIDPSFPRLTKPFVQSELEAAIASLQHL